jgi:hypothetical protein
LDGDGDGQVARSQCNGGKYFLRFVKLFLARFAARTFCKYPAGCRAIDQLVMGESLGQAIGERRAECGLLVEISIAGMFEGFAVAQD